jgi:hypothetical protein
MSQYWDYDERSSLTAGYLFTGKCLGAYQILEESCRSFDLLVAKASVKLARKCYAEN